MNSRSNYGNEDLYCKSCSIRFTNNEISKIHYNLMHRYSENTEPNRKLLIVSLMCSGKEQFKCKICNSGFVLKHHFLAHISVCHQDKEIALTMTEVLKF